MAKARKSKVRRSAKKAKRGSKMKTKSRAKTRKTRKPKARRTGLAKGAVGMAEEAAALRARLAGRNTFED